MRKAFTDNLGLSKHNRLRLNTINAVIEDYAQQGYRLTLRQLYYQLVTQNIISNNEREYAKLSLLLTKGRMSGVVDWYAIEDRIRQPKHTYSNEDPQDAIKDAIENYRLDRMADQPNYIELWVEKDALSNVLLRKPQHYHIRLMVNRGYSSTTAMYDSYQRFSKAINRKQAVHILYLGDHDPSGLDMVRDIHDRISNMLGVDFGEDFTSEALTVHHIGLTTEQVKLYTPPENPAKITDPRAANYIARYGKVSWEVDALNPTILHQIIDANITGLLDKAKFDAMLAQEEKDIEVLKKYPTMAEGILDLKMLIEEFKVPKPVKSIIVGSKVDKKITQKLSDYVGQFNALVEHINDVRATVQTL